MDEKESAETRLDAQEERERINAERLAYGLEAIPNEAANDNSPTAPARDDEDAAGSWLDELADVIDLDQELLEVVYSIERVSTLYGHESGKHAAEDEEISRRLDSLAESIATDIEELCADKLKTIADCADALQCCGDSPEVREIVTRRIIAIAGDK